MAQQDCSFKADECSGLSDLKLQDECWHCNYNYECNFDILFIERSKYIWYLSVSFQILSAVMLLFTGFYLLLHRNFQKHPFPLIAQALLFEGMSYITLIDPLYICYLNLPYFLTWTENIWIWIWTLDWEPLTSERIYDRY